MNWYIIKFWIITIQVGGVYIVSTDLPTYSYNYEKIQSELENYSKEIKMICKLGFIKKHQNDLVNYTELMLKWPENKSDFIGQKVFKKIIDFDKFFHVINNMEKN